MRDLDERLERVPIGIPHTLAQIADLIGTKPNTALKCRLLCTANFSAQRMLSPTSPIPKTIRWEFVRHE